MLLEMNDQHCESDTLDFRILFQGIQTSRKKNNDDKTSNTLFEDDDYSMYDKDQVIDVVGDVNDPNNDSFRNNLFNDIYINPDDFKVNQLNTIN